MKYGFISRRNKQSIERHTEALKPYDLAEIILDDFGGELDNLFERLKTGDSLYMVEPPRNTSKFIAIYSFARKHGIELYVNGEPVGDIPQLDLFEVYTKIETAKRLGCIK
jgi:hypothetical protein